MAQESKKGTPDQKIVHQAQVWRQRDRVAIDHKSDREKQTAEYRARQQLRDVIDMAGER